VKICFATFEAGAFDAGSIYRFARVPANARIKRIQMGCDDLTGGPMDIGVYPINSSTAVSADCYATDIDVDTAAVPVTANWKY
jgi:hypothetical protein